jgi:hypothetical protein
MKVMSNPFSRLNRTVGAALLALALTGAVAARADDPSTANPSAANQSEQQAALIEQMQSRMQAMQAQMAQLQTVTDPAERQKLLSAHMQLMQEQMASMRAMGGGMMQGMHGGTGMGMGSGMRAAGGGMGMRQGANAGQQPPGPRHQLMEDRVDMLQMMMEQMMGQMQMQAGPHGSGR